MANVAVSIFGTNLPIRLTDIGDKSYALSVKTVGYGQSMGANDKALSMLGTNIPIRVSALGDGSYAIAIARPVIPMPTTDKVASLFGINIPFRLVGLGDGTFALGAQTLTPGSSQSGNVAGSFLGINYPFRAVLQSSGDYALGIGSAIVPRPSADGVASLFGVNPPTRIVGLGDGTYVLAVYDSSFLLNDEFVTPRSAPLSSPRTAEPGPGTLTILDTASTLSIPAPGGIVIPSAAATGGLDPNIRDATGYARTQGRAFLAKVLQNSAFGNDANKTLSPLFGWSNASNPIALTSLYMMIWHGVFEAGILSASTTGIGLGIPCTPDTYYRMAAVLQSTGIIFLINETLAWVTTTGTDTPLYPIVSARNPARYNFNLDYFKVRDLVGLWTTLNGVATLNVASPVTATDYIGDADGIIDVTVTAPAVLANTMECRHRVLNAQNYWTMYFDNTGAFKVDLVVGGTPTNEFTAAGVIAGGGTCTMRCIMVGNRHNYYTLPAGSTWTARSLAIETVDTTFDAATGVRLATGTGWSAANLLSFPRNSPVYGQLAVP